MKVIFAAECSAPSNRKLLRQGWRISESNTTLDNTIEKLVGNKILDSYVVSRQYRFENSEMLPYSLRNIRLFKTRFSTFVLCFELESSKDIDFAKLRKLSSSFWSHINKLFGIDCEKQKTVYALGCVVTTSAKSVATWGVEDGTLHISAPEDPDLFQMTLASEISSRVAIEKSLITYSMNSRHGLLTKIVHSPYTGFLVRRWPTELLSGREFIADRYSAFRNSLNLPNVRAEILDRAKSWWTVVSVALGITGLILNWVLTLLQESKLN